MRISDWSSDVCSSDLPRISPLDNQCGKRCHRTGRVLDNTAHDVLKAVGDPVQLVLDRRADTHVATNQIAVPPGTHTDGTHAGCTANRDGVPATDRIHDLDTDDAPTILESTALRQGQTASQCT